MRPTAGGAGVVVLGAVLGALLAGCGGFSQIRSAPPITNVAPKLAPAGRHSKRFSAPGMLITFTFPARFVALPLVSRHVAGHNPHATHAAVGIGPLDMLIVSRFPGFPTPITAQNLPQLKSFFDGLMSRIFSQPMHGILTTIGGLPAILWPRKPLSGLALPVTSQVANVFVGHDEYELQCQATARELKTIEAACREMFATLGPSK